MYIQSLYKPYEFDQSDRLFFRLGWWENCSFPAEMAAHRALRLAAAVAGRTVRPHLSAPTSHAFSSHQTRRVWPLARGHLPKAPHPLNDSVEGARCQWSPLEAMRSRSAWNGWVRSAAVWYPPESTAAGRASPGAARRGLAGSSGPGTSNAYTMLGVEKGRSDREYKVAYLKLAKTCHPDMNPGDKDATARFQVQP